MTRLLVPLLSFLISQHREKLLFVSHHHGKFDFQRLLTMNSMFAKDRDYVRMNFMSFKDMDIGEETSRNGRSVEKVSKEDDIGTPLRLLHEGEGHRVTVEIKNGDKFRGTLIESEDSWTSQLEDITYISRKKKKLGQRGRRQRTFKLNLVFIRGRRIRFIIFPDMLMYAPLFMLPNAKTKEEKGDDLRLSLKLLHLTNYSQRIATEQGRYYI